VKIDVLASIAHDIADSLGSGESLVFNLWGIDLFRDAATSDGGVLEIDLLGGKLTRGSSSPDLIGAIQHGPRILASFAAPHGGLEPAPKAVVIKFFVERSHLGVLRRFSTYVEDAGGKSRTAEFYGSPGRRLAQGKTVPPTAWALS
jgi:hypothetical protein